MIEIRNLTKRFDRFTAVDSLNLTIGTGEFFGLLGPNGAGKTTTIGMLSTLLLPTEGEIYIDSERLSRKRTDLKRKLSVITQEYSMRQDMTMDRDHGVPRGGCILCPAGRSAPGRRNCWTSAACWSSAGGPCASCPAA